MRFVSELRARVTTEKYFTFGIVGLLLAFLLLPNSKWVANYYYLLILLPATVLVMAIRVPRQPLIALLLLWVLFAIWLLASGFQGGEFGFFKHWGYLLAFCIVMISWVQIQRFRRLRFFELAFAALASYICISAVVFWVQGFPVGERILELPFRLSGPILTSMLLVALLAACLPAWHTDARRWRLLAAFALTFICVGFILQSRSGVVGLIAIAACYLLFLFILCRGWVWRLALMVVIILTAVIAVWAFRSFELLQLLVTRGDSGRVELWSAYVRELQQCGWVWGCGPAFAGSIYIMGGEFLIQHPHNIFLVAIFYHGLPALVLLLGIFCSTLWHAWRQKNPWGLYLLVALLMLQFDGNRLVNRPDEIWLLVYLPCMLILAEALRSTSAAGPKVPSGV